MKMRQFLYIIICLVFFSCLGGSQPRGVLSKKKMARVLVDIHLADAINNQKFNLSMIRDSLPEDLYLSICRKHGIQKSEIENSLVYYGKHTREYLPVYEEVLDILNEMQVKAEKDTLRPVHTGGADKPGVK